ncbi:MAG: hypothetical protein KGM44_01960 [bacterium]|nr:hypothetical protein [bacterium]
MIAERSDTRWIPVRHAKRGTRLGEGIGDAGALRPEAIARTLEAAVSFAAIARACGAELRALATSAMRRASNAAALTQPLATQTGARLEIVSGEDEARYSFIGALAGHGEGIAPGARVGVLDVGGGSSELAIGTTVRLERWRSFEMGAVRLTESTPLREDPPPPQALAEARERARGALAGVEEIGAGIERLICVGGTATTCAGIVTRGEREGEQADGVRISRRDPGAIAERLGPLPVAERMRTPGLPAQRADIIVGGAVLLEQAFAMLDVQEAITSIHDLLLGYITAGWR